MLRLPVILLTAFLAALPAAAVDNFDEFLTIGDPAPDIDVAHWLRGKEVTSFGDGTIYVLEFWATWCVPCRESMPHLSDLQERYRQDGVRVIGISDEKLQTVVSFYATPHWKERIDYALATDPDRSTQRDIMSASASGTIPRAFLIGRDGTIEWIGHPKGLDEPLARVIDESWDRDAYKIEFEKATAPARARARAVRAIKQAYADKDWPTLIEMFDDAIEATPDEPYLRIQKFQIMVGEMAEPSRGYEYGRELLEMFWNESKHLNQIAWFVADNEHVAMRDLEFAKKAAMRASELTRHENAAILDTVARVMYEQGDLMNALYWQRNAVDHLKPDDPLAAGILAARDKFESEARRKKKDKERGGDSDG